MIARSRVGCALLCCTAAIISGCAAAGEHAEVLAVIEAQETAWNRGDLDAFMEGYWRSDELTFTTPDGLTRGWQAIRDRYRSKYPDASAMGRLYFDKCVASRTGEDTASIAGRYRVESPAGKKSGRFFLHLRRVDGQWRIVRDHTVPDVTASPSRHMVSQSCDPDSQSHDRLGA